MSKYQGAIEEKKEKRRWEWRNARRAGRGDGRGVIWASIHRDNGDYFKSNPMRASALRWKSLRENRDFSTTIRTHNICSRTHNTNTQYLQSWTFLDSVSCAKKMSANRQKKQNDVGSMNDGIERFCANITEIELLVCHLNQNQKRWMWDGES